MQETRPNIEEWKEDLYSKIIVTKSELKIEDIKGIENVKDYLTELIVLPLKVPSIFRGTRRPTTNCLLYGPPGTGKKSIVKAIGLKC